MTIKTELTEEEMVRRDTKAWEGAAKPVMVKWLREAHAEIRSLRNRDAEICERERQRVLRVIDNCLGFEALSEIAKALR